MTSIVTARVDSEKRKAAERIFSEVGITTSGAINLFICAVALNGGIPFSIGVREAGSTQQSAPSPDSRKTGALRLGLADGKYKLPESFDADFDALDEEVSALFNGD